MKVFLSWSGDLSRELGEAFRKWLPSVLQMVRPYFTPSDIEKGARWSAEIAKELETSAIGVFFVTKENHNSPWMAFEAGAISKVVTKGRVCPVLFGLKPTDITGPLLQFQCSEFCKSGVLDLLKMVNNSAPEEKRLSEETLASVFEKWWPDLEACVERISCGHDDTTNANERSDRDILEEMLGILRTTTSASPLYANKLADYFPYVGLKGHEVRRFLSRVATDPYSQKYLDRARRSLDYLETLVARRRAIDSTNGNSSENLSPVDHQR